MTTKFLAFITILMLLFTSACSTEHDTPVPALSDSDITIVGVGIELSDRWVTNGTNFTITLRDMSFETSSKDVTLSYIEVERDGKTIGSAKYTPTCSVAIRVDNWSHGENNLKLIAVFTSPMGNVSKEIMNSRVIVFNQLPTYNIEGIAISEFINIDTISRNPYYHIIELTSENHIFQYYFSFLDVDPLSGTSYKVDRLSNVNLAFFVDKEKTNFDAEITKQELHWRSVDGPASLPSKEELADDEVLYVGFTVIGTHEDIDISQDSMIGFRFIRQPK